MRREFLRSSAVFSAYVQRAGVAEIDGRRTRMVTLRVLQVWKGDVRPNTSIDVESDDDAGLVGCGYRAEPEHALMVYVSGDRRPFALVSCSMTGPLESATDDIPLLNKLSKRRGR